MIATAEASPVSRHDLIDPLRQPPHTRNAEEGGHRACPRNQAEDLLDRTSSFQASTLGPHELDGSLERAARDFRESLHHGRILVGQRPDHPMGISPADPVDRPATHIALAVKDEKVRLGSVTLTHKVYLYPEDSTRYLRVSYEQRWESPMVAHPADPFHFALAA